METLVVNFAKPMNNEENSTDFLPTLNMSQQQIMARIIGRWMNQGSDYIIDSVNEHYINVVKDDPLRGNSYILLPPEFRNGKKGLINIQNGDDECFHWCHVHLLNPQEKDPQWIKSSDKILAQRLNYDGVKFPVSVKDYHRIEAQNSINIVFGYEDRCFFSNLCVQAQKC